MDGTLGGAIDHKFGAIDLDLPIDPGNSGSIRADRSGNAMIDRIFG